jgi:hypothetical protein
MVHGPCRRVAALPRFTRMRQKSDKSKSQKAAKQKTRKTEPVPPVEEDKGHGEEVASAKRVQKR